MLDTEADLLLDGLVQGIEEFRTRSKTPVVLNSLIAARRGVERYFDRTMPNGRQHRIDDLNHRLTLAANALENVTVFDYAGLVTDYGRERWFDLVRHHSNHCAITSPAVGILARELSRYADILVSPRRKVLAVDLDNTLWGGIVGEDGVDGLHLGGDYPGNAYRDFQACIANLRASGIALATISKNNLDDAVEVFESNPGLPLQWAHFASQQVNWLDKVENLKTAAAEIGVGVDSFAFIDDSPVECEMVRHFLPDVACLQMSGSPSLFVDLLLSIDGLHAARLAPEDLSRAKGYAAERERRDLRASSTDVNGFLARLGLTLTVGAPTAAEMPRVAQLFQKTNQFNLTTKRYDLADLLERQQDPDWRLRVAKLTDNFGDYGMIGVTLLRFTEADCEIDSLLMSCRALGRKVEDALIALIENEAREADRHRLVGRYVPTKKNQQVADLYPRFGFAVGDEENVFVKALGETPALACPEIISVEYQEP